MVSILPLQAAGSAVALLFGLLMFAVYVAIIVWTYNDAKQRSDHPAFLWALVVFFAPFLGLVLYWILGRNSY